MLFRNRADAGEKLAQGLLAFAGQDDVLVLALPRGGVPVGYEISTRLHVPLDLILVRKLGVPGQEELALGAIAGNNIRVMNTSIVENLSISAQDIEQIVAHEQHELNRRNQLYRQGSAFPVVRDRVIILVDDGIATGATMRAAIKVVSWMQPKQIIVSVPVASTSVYQELPLNEIELQVLATPEPFWGVGRWYREFPQVTDQEVIALLTKADA